MPIKNYSKISETTHTIRIVLDCEFLLNIKLLRKQNELS